MTTTQDVPEGERLAKVEAAVESIVREMSELRADLRELRSEIHSLSVKIDRNFLWTIGIIMTMWVSLITAIIIAILVD